MRRPLLALLLISFSVAAAARAEDNALTRDEVTVVKRKLQALESALAGPPAGFERAKEEFQLPTEFSRADGGRYYPINASARLQYDGGIGRIQQKAGTQAQDAQKRMMDAMAKGDYEQVAKIQQELTQQANANQSQAMDASSKGTIDVTLVLNEGGGATIDPDAVLFEKPGVLALKAPGDNPTMERITVYADPVGLKSTKTLSTVTLRHDPTPKKVAALNASITLSGPTAVVETWAKKIATDGVLAQLDP